jgi:hypothetical protein
MTNELFKLAEINTNVLKIPTDNVIEVLAENYQCMLQFHIPINPLQCSNCENLICSSCLQDLQNQNKKCPLCRNILIPKEPARLAKITLESFTLKCLNSECPEQIKYEKFIEHYTNCKYTERDGICTGCDKIIRTTNKFEEIIEHNKICNSEQNCHFCEKIILTKEMPKHLKVCEEREITCPYCFEMFAFSNLYEHWSKECAADIIKLKDKEVRKLKDVLAVKDKEIAVLEKNYEASQKNNESLTSKLYAFIKAKYDFLTGYNNILGKTNERAANFPKVPESLESLYTIYKEHYIQVHHIVDNFGNTNS